MKAAGVIQKAILSEKTHAQMERGLYTFLVDRRATKTHIAQALAAQFAVKVVKVNTLQSQPKTKRIAKTRKETKVGGGKKAVVLLAPGQKIAMFAAKSPPPTKTAKKEKDIQVVTEGKEG